MNDATTLRIALELDPRDWTLTLRVNSALCGQERLGPIALPFSAADLSIIERALDLNDDSGLKRAFAVPDLERLHAWGLLLRPTVEHAGAPLSGQSIRRDRLRDQVRTWLAGLLLDPLAQQLNQHFAVQRERTGGQRPLLYLRLEGWPADLPLWRLPWELLHRHRLAQGDIQVGRYILYGNAPGLPPPASGLRLLVLHSDPADAALPRLHLKDRERIDEGLQGTPGASRIQVQTLAPASLTAFQEALRADPARPTIVHFAGHGDFGWRCGRCGRISVAPDDRPCGDPDCGFERHGPPAGLLAFTDPRTGAADWVGIDGVCEALGLARDLRLVVLSACQSATARGGTDVFNGIAQRLMDLVPAVIATPYPLESGAAEEFARCLYRALGEGLSLVECLHQVRLLMAERFPDEWYRPVLYLRASQGDGGRLLDLPARADRVPGHDTHPVVAAPDPRREALARALAQFVPQYQAALSQSVTTSDAVAAVQAGQRAEEIERTMAQLRQKIDRLAGRAA
jgi:hypothetical protein